MLCSATISSFNRYSIKASIHLLTLLIFLSIPFSSSKANDSQTDSEQAGPRIVNLDPKDFRSGSLGFDLQVFEDVDNQYSFEEIQQQTKWTTPAVDVPTFGFRSSVFWLRFRLNNPEPRPGLYYLEIGYPLLDHMDLYTPGEDGYTVNPQGYGHTFSQRDLRHRHTVFSVEVPPGEHMYYMRVKSESSINLNLKLWEPQTFIEHVYEEQMILGIYYGVMVVMILYNFFIYFSIKDVAYLHYVLYILGYTLYQATLNGYSFQYFWPDAIWWANHSLPMFMGFGAFWGVMFTRSFLKTSIHLPRFDKVLLTFAVLCIAAIPMALILPYAIVIRYAAAVIGLMVLLLYVTGVMRFIDGYKPARFFLLAWTMLILGIVGFVLKTFGILPETFLTRWSQQIGSALEVVLLSFALADRIKIITREKEQAQEEALKNQKLAIENLEKADRLKDEFLARTSHELRTPLNGIIGLTDATMEAAGSTRISKRVFYDNLNMVSTSARRLSTLVNDILDFSRLKNADIELRLRPVDIEKNVALVLTLSQPLATNIDLKLDIPENLPLALADEDRLQQILINLVGNAIKFTHNGSVTVFARQSGEKIRISIIDTGIGIPVEKQGQIFESFEQGENSISRNYGGTGLGLAIVRSLTKLHGSEVTLESEPGKGSTFSFELDIASETQEKRTTQNDKNDIRIEKNVSNQNETANSREIVSSQSRNDSLNPEVQIWKDDTKKRKTGHTILCVDDEPVNLKVLENYLQHYRILTATDGFQAIEYVEKEKPDLILLDLMMPRMSGYEVISKLRETYPPSLLPVIILSAKGQVSDMVHGLEMGANDYLTKPFSKEELLARIDVHMDLRNALRGQILQSQAFHRFVPTQFLHLLNRSDVTEVEHGDSALMEMTVLFSDIRSFSLLAEELTVEDNFRFLNSFLHRMVPCIEQSEGFVDKFIGDAIMALFPGKTKSGISSAANAVRAAVSMRHQLNYYNEYRKERGRLPIEFGMGINTGELMMGTVGTEHRLDTTVIGDTVNLSSRLESLTTLYRVPVLISDFTYRGLEEDQVDIREVDSVIVKGKKQPIIIYEVFEADDSEIRNKKHATMDDLSVAIMYYKGREFQTALELFQKILNIFPEDTVAGLYASRCKQYIENPPAEDWQGVVTLTEK